MGKAIIAFILSVGVGTWLSFFNHGIGVVVSISIIGAFLIYQNENKIGSQSLRLQTKLTVLPTPPPAILP